MFSDGSQTWVPCTHLDPNAWREPVTVSLAITSVQMMVDIQSCQVLGFRLQDVTGNTLHVGLFENPYIRVNREIAIQTVVLGKEDRVLGVKSN